MHINASLETHPSFISLRLGSLELFAAREPEWAPEGWLKVCRPGPGEIGISLGRWAVLAVNHRRVTFKMESQGL